MRYMYTGVRGRSGNKTTCWLNWHLLGRTFNIRIHLGQYRFQIIGSRGTSPVCGEVFNNLREV
jgi:hypothetical protein